MIRDVLHGLSALTLIIAAACGSEGAALTAPYAICGESGECAEGVCKPHRLSSLPNSASDPGTCVPSCETDADCPPLAEGDVVCVRGDCVPACVPAVEGEFLPRTETLCIDGEWSECTDLAERPCACGCGDLVCPPRADGTNPSNEQRDLDEVCVPKRAVGEPCDADWQCRDHCSPIAGSFVCVEPAGTPCDAATFCDCEAGADGTGYCKEDCQSQNRGNTCSVGAASCTGAAPLDPNRFVPNPPYTHEGRCYLRCDRDSPSCPGSTTCTGNGGFGIDASGMPFDIHICVGR